MTLQLLNSEFPYLRGKFDFLFYQCVISSEGISKGEMLGRECVSTEAEGQRIGPDRRLAIHSWRKWAGGPWIVECRYCDGSLSCWYIVFASSSLESRMAYRISALGYLSLLSWQSKLVYIIQRRPLKWESIKTTCTLLFHSLCGLRPNDEYPYYLRNGYSPY